jgi:hypothetical protein
MPGVRGVLVLEFKNCHNASPRVHVDSIWLAPPPSLGALQAKANPRPR